VDSQRAAGGKVLSEHLKDFEMSLLAKGNTKKQIQMTISRIQRVFKGCTFVLWNDITANQVERFLVDLRQRENISAATYNYYLKSMIHFCRWMIENKRGSDNPLQYLKVLNTRTDRRHDRRALEPDEIRRLLEATASAETRFGMDGYQRALLYRLAIETGLRAGELKSLTVSAFDLDGHTITLEAAYSKHRRQDKLPLRSDTVNKLRGFLSGKMPTVKVFRMPDKACKMIQADLKEAGIAYVDDGGRYADFHSLRHTCGSLLAVAGVHPKTAQTLMRHSDINLTMSRYTHLFAGQESQAVESLPDLSLPSEQAQEQTKTGTDNDAVYMARSMALSGAKQGNDAHYGAQRNRAPYNENAVFERGRRGSNPQPSDRQSDAEISQRIVTSTLTETNENDMAHSMALLLQKHPDLAQVVEHWPNLPEHIKAAIKALVKTNFQGDTQ